MGARFDQRAKELCDRVWAEGVRGDTEALLVYHLEDEQGRPLPPWKYGQSATCSFECPGDPKEHEAIVLKAYRNLICGNLQRSLRRAPDGLGQIPGGPPYPVRIVAIDLEFVPHGSC